jgi:uncharacterized membrane-anchored protein
MRRAAVIVGALLVLAAANWTIYQKQQVLAAGRIVLLDLAPVDPRSLMQGDYMALRFRVTNEAFRGDSSQWRDGRLVLKLNEQGVGTFVRFDNGQALAGDEVRVQYRIRNGQPKFATNAFFFQEGHADLYARARYGEFRVDPTGEAILTGMRGEKYEPLGPGR